MVKNCRVIFLSDSLPRQPACLYSNVTSCLLSIFMRLYYSRILIFCTMKLLGIFLLVGFQSAFGQYDTTIYYKDPGWTLHLPGDFKIVDSTLVAAKQKSGTKMLEDTSHQPADLTHTRYFITAMRDKQNYFSANFTVSPYITAKNWQSVDSTEKETFLRTLAAQIRLPPDSSSSLITLDGVPFKKLQASFPMGEKSTFIITYLGAFFKGKYLAVIYFYIDPAAGNEITQMLSHSTFDK
jgi:hypothetical protein